MLELKALKYYFLTFRNVGIIQEQLTTRIFNDLYSLLEPEELSIYYDQSGLLKFDAPFSGRARVLLADTDIRKNIEKVCKKIGCNKNNLILLNQVHSNSVHKVSKIPKKKIKG